MVPCRTFVGASAVFGFVTFVSCTTSLYTLSDRAAKDIFVQLMNNPARTNILPLGRLSVVSAAHEHVEGIKGNDKISQEAYVYYQNLQRNNLITITNFQDLTESVQGWNSWFSLSQQGIAKQFSAKPTTEAKILTCPEATLKKLSTGKALCLSDGQLHKLSLRDPNTIELPEGCMSGLGILSS